MLEKLQNQIINSFNRLCYDSVRHVYYLNNRQVNTISGLTYKFKVPFDEKNEALKVAAEEQKDYREVIREWRENNQIAKEKGIRIHNFLEQLIYNPGTNIESDLDKAVNEALTMIQSKGCTVMFGKTQIYSEKMLFTGNVDSLVFYNGGVIMVDYKYSNDIHKNNENQTLLRPFESVLDTPLTTVFLQQIFKQIALEEAGINVLGGRVVWIKDDGKYEFFSNTLTVYKETIINEIKRQ